MLDKITTDTNLLEAVLDSIAEGVAILDSEGTLITFNAKGLEILGVKPSHTPLSQLAIQYGIYKIDQKTPYLPHELPAYRALKGEFVDDVELVIQNPQNPKLIFLNSSARPIKSKQGKILGAVVVFRDITESQAKDREIEKLTRNLELKVHERTRELASTNEKLAEEIAERIQAEERLRKRKTVLRLVLDQLPAVLWTTDLDLKTTLVLGKATTKIDFNNRKILGMTIQDILQDHCPDLGPVEIHQRALQGESLSDTIQLGKYNYQFHVEPLRDSQKQIMGVIGIAYDVTEAKAAAKALQQQQKEQEIILNSVSALIWYQDCAGHIIRINRFAAQTIGLSPEEALGKPVKDIYWDNPEKYQQDDKAVIQSGQSKLGVIESCRNRAGKKIWILADKIPYRDENGEIIGLIVFASDITRHQEEQALLNKKNELALRYQAGLLEMAKLENLELSLAIKRIVETNAKTLKVDRVSLWLYNADCSEIICQSLYSSHDEHFEQGMVLQSNQYPEYFKALEESRTIAASNARQDPRTSEFTENYLKPLNIFSMMDVPIRLRGKVIGVLCHEQVGEIREWSQEDQDFASSVSDMISLAMEADERRKTEEALRQKTEELARSNAELEQFAYVASHDLQEPLHLIIAFADRLRSQFAESLGEKGIDYLSRIDRSASRMRQLIEDLLQYARVNTRKKNFEPIQLRELILEVLGDLEMRLTESGAKLEMGMLPSVFGDRFQMRQLFQNLIANALKFRREDIHSVIRIQATPKDSNFAEIHVEDNGIGFDTKYLEKIFKPFHRLYGTSRYEGSGMGLAICKKIVERHGGKISAQSVLNQGTQFIFTLPLA